MRQSRSRLGKRMKGHVGKTFFSPQQHEYRELFRWQREAMGLRGWEYKLSRRPEPRESRYNPSAAHITRGTTGYAWRWKLEHQPHIPNLPPNDYVAPEPIGRGAWPTSWTEDFANEIIALDDEQLRNKIFSELTQAIFDETQRDGYELRRLDFESKPLTELPDPDVISAFVLEEDTIRDRILRLVVENIYGFIPTSKHREELRSVEQIIDYIIARVKTCREPQQMEEVSDEVKKILSEFPVQPEFGFVHALPGSKWGDLELLEQWELLFHHPWQFGRAVFTPRTVERTQGNITWLRMEEEWRQRQEFAQQLESGELRDAHMHLIKEAEHGIAE